MHRKLAHKAIKEGKHRQAKREALKAVELHLAIDLKDRAANELVGVSVTITLDKDRAANDFRWVFQ